LRVGHVYGPGEEKYSKFLPKAINSILAGESIELWGDGSEVRSFIYVDDVVCAIMKAIELNESAGPINVVGGWPVSIRELLDQLIVISGKSVSISARERSGTGRNYINDNTKMREKLLSEETDLITGLQIEYSYMAGLA
jgi:UDP-glucose 4-epimerase